jgi:hypothetical protein
MKKLFIIFTMTSVMFAANAMAGPSAKFAATYGNDGPYLVSAVFIDGADVDTGPVIDMSVGFTFATIKVPQDKELLVGLSAEVGITTDTSIKGKNGGAARSIAGGRARVLVFACPVGGGSCTALARPGSVTLSERIQTLSATLGGVIEECEDFTGGTDENGLNPGDVGYIDTPDGIIDVDVECLVTDEEIGLALDTLASHHFNFVLPNMDQGEYNVRAVFATGAMAEVDIDDASLEDGGTVSASAFASAWIGSYMLTLQQVRAAKGGIIDRDIIEP